MGLFSNKEKKECPSCGGNGTQVTYTGGHTGGSRPMPNTKRETCSTCKGKGYIKEESDRPRYDPPKSNCMRCGGSGYISKKPLGGWTTGGSRPKMNESETKKCPRCNGTGKP